MESLAATADVAAIGKLSAVKTRYYDDPFVPLFASTPVEIGSSSLGAMINRGQYARVVAMDSVLTQFLDAVSAAGGHDAQIISLGAGLDTRFWLLSTAGRRPARFVEIDQASVVLKKASIVASKAELLSIFPEGRACVSERGICSPASGYTLAAANLTNVSELEAVLGGVHGWDCSAPTLVIAECVLVYMAPATSVEILAWFGSRCRRAVLAAYEQVGPDDAFGRQMLVNLRQRGCPLLGLPHCPTTAAQRERALATGWGRAEAVDVLSYFDTVGVYVCGVRGEFIRHSSAPGAGS